MELLSPAGNLEKLKIAIDYGADAVYGGVSHFSLRIRSGKEFDLVSFKEGIDFVGGSLWQFKITQDTPAVGD